MVRGSAVPPTGAMHEASSGNDEHGRTDPVGQGAEQPFSAEAPNLLRRHAVSLLQSSGIALEVVIERGYYSALGKKTLKKLGFSDAQCRLPALVVPVWGPDGSNGLFQARPDNPRVDSRGRPVKYETPSGAGLRLDCPPRCRPMLSDPTVPLWITEGVKKADAGASHGLCVVALLGVWNFKGKNAQGGITFLADWDYIALNGRVVRIVFDSDVASKPEVQAALARLREHLERNKAKVSVVYLPGGPNGAKVGLDDYLLSHTVDELQALAQAPAPQPAAAAPTIELLEEAPLTLNRPLALVEGHAYAAVWLYVRTTTTEYLDDKTKQIHRLGTPDVRTEQRLFIVHGDGAVYGDGADKPLADLGLQVALADVPREARLWRTSGVNAYRRGERPDVRAVFGALCSVYDRYLDFSRSLAGQQTMVRLSACASLQTWYMAAFTVLGYLWPNGEKGSGKTKWATVWANTAYLGELLTMGGSFAALRDLANYGASLAFDDAESIGDVKKVDPDKRALVLAGNRLGVQIPLKEAAPDGTWHTRWVNAYCPRVFTSIGLPDHVSASRAIVLPLVRTGNAAKGNADPAALNTWPVDQRWLQDQLWAMALWLLPEAARIWTELDSETGAVGRDFEPWRALVACARLMERHGIEGLEADIRSAMEAYRTERTDDGDDWTVCVIAALVALALDTKTTSDTMDTNKGEWQLTATEVSKRVETMYPEALHPTKDGAMKHWASASRIGRILAALRLPHGRQATAERTRLWTVTRDNLIGLAMAYGVSGLDTTTADDAPSPTSVHSGQSVHSVQAALNLAPSDEPGEVEEGEL